MAVLTHDEIKTRIDTGVIAIDPFDPTAIGPASIDCTLGTAFRVFRTTGDTIDLKSERFDPDSYSDVITVDDHLVIRPNETVLGITVEKITLPPTICGWIQGRSRFARIGLMVHITSSFIQPGVSNKQVLELFNAGSFPIALYPGIRICQIVLEETLGSASYRGTFQHQTLP